MNRQSSDITLIKAKARLFALKKKESYCRAMVLGSRIPIIAIDDDDDNEDDLMHMKIFVKVTGLEGENDTFFKIEIHLPLQWVMIKYCDIKKLDYESTRFEFNGSRLRHMDTPYLLGMVHNNSIYASPATESGIIRFRTFVKIYFFYEEFIILGT